MPTLIPCPACKKKMSAEAGACPKCGHPLDEAEREKALKEQADAKKGAVILLALLVIGFGAWKLFGGTSEPKNPAKTTTAAATAARQPSPAPQASVPAAPPAVAKPKPTFPMTVEVFVKAFNANANTPKKSTINLKVKPETEKSGEAATTVQATISPNNGMVIGKDPGSGKITSVTIISGGEKFSAKDTAEMFLAWITMVQTLSPELAPEERGQVLRDMGAVTEPMAEKGETRRNGVRYWHSMGQGMGIWFGAEAS